MCGVIGLTYEHDVTTIGQVATKMLKMLEYRGYDSTGAIIQDGKGRVTLKKDVGAPSVVAVRLGVDKLQGRVFCGQVRWATFGVVTRENAQPHEMSCKTHMYGAHNGNITNCERLREWLIAQGHQIKSDNNGEMLVHTVEHFFAEELTYKDAKDPAVRYQAMKQAVILAGKKMVGSYAAVVVDPVTRNMVAIKAGSSLYIGKGLDPVGGNFHVASSDLASVLQITRVLIPIRESEFAIYSGGTFDLYDLKTGRKLKRASQRSLLRVEETTLQAPHAYFMEQEIAHQVDLTQRVITLFSGGNALTQALRRNAKSISSLKILRNEVRKLAELTESRDLTAAWKRWLAGESGRRLRKIAHDAGDAGGKPKFESGYAGFLEELRGLTPSEQHQDLTSLLNCLDASFDLEDIEDLEKRIKTFVQLVNKARKTGNTVYVLACGSSFHAAKTAPIRLPWTERRPALSAAQPG